MTLLAEQNRVGDKDKASAYFEAARKRMEARLDKMRADKDDDSKYRIEKSRGSYDA